MKKIFTLVAAVMVSAVSFAQSFNFSDFEEKAYEEKTVVNGLTINGASGAAITIDANSKTVDDVQYTRRLKFGGSGSKDSRNISFDVAGAGVLKLIATSSSSSADRTATVLLGENSLGDIDAKGGVVAAKTVNVTGAGTITIFANGGGVNLYLVEFTSGTTGVKTTFFAGEDGATYDLQGVKVGADYKGVVVKNGKKFVK